MPQLIRRYQLYEIAPCIPVNFDGSEKVYERIDSLRSLTKRERKGLIWTLYGWRQGLGLECVGDFDTKTYAIEVYECITGHRVTRSSPLGMLVGLEP